MNKVLTKNNKSDIIIKCKNRDGDMTVITRLKRAFGRCENVPMIYELPPLSAFNTGRSASVMSLLSGNFFAIQVEPWIILFTLFFQGDFCFLGRYFYEDYIKRRLGFGV